MKTIYAAVLLCLFFLPGSSLQAQCDFPDGDFENWVDITGNFSDDLPEGTIIVPENTVSFFRLIVYVLQQGFIEGVIQGTLDISDLNLNLLGVERSEDASSGNFSVKLRGDTLALEADILLSNTCAEGADTLYFDAKHIGAVTDTLDIFCFVGSTSAVPITNDGSFDQNQINKFLSIRLVAGATSPTFQTLALPLNEVNPAVQADTAIIWIIMTGGIPADGDEFGCTIIDNVRFKNQGNTTNTEDFEIVDNVELFPSLTNDFITLKTEASSIENIQIFDLSGKSMIGIQNLNSNNHQVDVSTFPAGQYATIIKTSKGYSTKKFIKIE